MKIKNFTKIFLFVALAAIFSCSSSGDEDGGGNNGNAQASITVTPSASFVDFGTAITFTVTTNQGTNVTSESNILVNNEGISGNTFLADATGVYNVTATYQGLTSSAVSVNVLPVTVSIEIRSTNETYNIGDRIDFQVIAFDNDGNETNVTTAARVNTNGSESFSGASFIPGTTGTIDANAEFNDFTSNTKIVTIEDNAPSQTTFTKRALIEDYTGTWCGWCPRVVYGLELVKEQSDKVAIVAVHAGDQMSNTTGNALIQAFNPSGSYPTAMINRDVEWNFPEPNNVGQATSLAQGFTSTGVSIVTARKDRNMSLLVSAGFGENLSGAKLVILLLENRLFYDQENYTDYYGGLDVLPNFVHDHVLRHAFTAPLGDVIPSGDLVSGNTFRTKIDYTMPSNIISNPSQAEVVAMIVGANNKIINVNMVKVGNISDF